MHGKVTENKVKLRKKKTLTENNFTIWDVNIVVVLHFETMLTYKSFHPPPPLPVLERVIKYETPRLIYKPTFLLVQEQKINFSSHPQAHKEKEKLYWFHVRWSHFLAGIMDRGRNQATVHQATVHQAHENERGNREKELMCKILALLSFRGVVHGVALGVVPHFVADSVSLEIPCCLLLPRQEEITCRKGEVPCWCMAVRHSLCFLLFIMRVWQNSHTFFLFLHNSGMERFLQNSRPEYFYRIHVPNSRAERCLPNTRKERFYRIREKVIFIEHILLENLCTEHMFRESVHRAYF